MPSKQMNREKAGKILKILHEEYPNVVVGFHYRVPFKVLITTILSAQSTDRQTGPAAEFLFEQFPTAELLAEASVSEVEDRIRSVGLYKNKAKFIIATANMILERFRGKVPDTMKELLSLPGVGRKTANIVLSSAFGKNEGIAVDTHVYRLSHRLGLAKSNVRDKVEEELVSLYPSSEFIHINHLLIHHGRVICNARNPKCELCSLSELCDHFSENEIIQRTDAKE